MNNRRQAEYVINGKRLVHKLFLSSFIFYSLEDAQDVALNFIIDVKGCILPMKTTVNVVICLLLVNKYDTRDYR